MRKLKAIFATAFIATIMTASAYAGCSDNFNGCAPSRQSCQTVPDSYTVNGAPDIVFVAAVIDLASLTVLEMCDFLANGLHW